MKDRTSSLDKCVHCQRGIGKCLEQRLVRGHQRHGQRARERDKLSNIGSQGAARDNVEHNVIADAVFAFGERFVGTGQYSDDLSS